MVQLTQKTVRDSSRGEAGMYILSGISVLHQRTHDSVMYYLCERFGKGTFLLCMYVLNMCAWACVQLAYVWCVRGLCEVIDMVISVFS